MASLLLPAFISFVWMLWLFACLLDKAVQDDRLGIPPGERHGVSIAPGIPVFPLAFWGAAVLINLFAAPWGTRIVGGFHLLLGTTFVYSIVAALLRLRAVPPPA